MPSLATRMLLVTLLVAGVGTPAVAQDTFEIQVYEYQTVPRGKWDIETHLNLIQRGTRLFEGSVAPTQHQTHLTFELTRGVTDYFEMAGYLVTARRDGAAPEFAGWRLRPRVRAPDSWKLPVRLSLSVEVGFPDKKYEEAQSTFEFRPIIEKTAGKWQFDVNPVLGRALKGPGSGEGWDFEPGVRIAYETSKLLDLSVEYYGATGSVTDPLPAREQVHQFFPGGDINFSENVVLNFGLGLGATNVGNRMVWKTRLGIIF
jgi:hypothetical protein